MIIPDNRERSWPMRVAVLRGGDSSERDVSLTTGAQIASALGAEGFDVWMVDARDLARSARAGCAPEAASCTLMAPGRSGPEASPDIVFIALHGKGGEDGVIQGLLEVLGLPYTGSGVLASALAMDKGISKKLFRAEGIPIVEGVQVQKCDGLASGNLDALLAENLDFPLFVKPNAEGSTFGCSLVERAEELGPAIEAALSFDSSVLVERYVRGRELTVGVIEGPGRAIEVLPVVEIVPKGVYYDYESKYADGGSEHLIPAPIKADQTARAQNYALRCHRLLNCRGVSRTDLILTGDDLVVLEVNTIPGMTPTSLLPQAAEAAGIPFRKLLTRIIQASLC